MHCFSIVKSCSAQRQCSLDFASYSSEFSKGAVDGSCMCIMSEPPQSASDVLHFLHITGLCSAEMPDPAPTQTAAVSADHRVPSPGQQVLQGQALLGGWLEDAHLDYSAWLEIDILPTSLLTFHPDRFTWCICFIFLYRSFNVLHYWR